MTLKIVPYGDTEVTGNGVTYTPNTTPVYDLGIADFIVSNPGDNPIEVNRLSLADTFNAVPIEYKDRSLLYNNNTISDPEAADIEAFGERRRDTVSMPCITRQAHALVLSRILAQRSCYVRNTYKFTVGWKYALLEPMDLITITEPLLGIDHLIVRIKSIEEDETSLLTIEAEEWPFGIGSSTAYTTENGTPGGQPPHNDPPGEIATHCVFDVPVLYRENIAAHEIAIGAASVSQMWGGCQVWTSADGTSYSLAGVIKKSAKIGVTTASLPASTVAVDVTNTLSVDLSDSQGTLLTATETDMEDLVTLCFCDGELLAYEDANLTSAYHYDLDTLRRGAYGTDASTAHASGSEFARVDDAFIRFVLPDARIGSLLYIKLVGFNIYGNALEDISGVSPVTHTPAAQYPPSPSNVELSTSLISGGEELIFNPNTGLTESISKYNFTISWDLVATADDPSFFEVVCYTGSDPETVANQVFAPTTVPGGKRATTVTVKPLADIDDIHTAVRSIYA